jgi:hypothetical protein
MADKEAVKAEPCKTAILAGGTCPDCGWEAGKSIEPHSVALTGSHFMRADELAAAEREKEEMAATMAAHPNMTYLEALKAENAELKAKLGMAPPPMTPEPPTPLKPMFGTVPSND